MNHYSDISLPVLTKHLTNAKWVFKTDIAANELNWVMQCYSPGNSIAGCTDYTNHIKAGNQIDHYKTKVFEDIRLRLCQIGNYYNINGKPFDTVVIVLTGSGWSAEAKWSDGSTCYFKHIYAEAAKAAAEKRAQEEVKRKAQAKARREEKRKKIF